ncbi:MAG TPA: LCP family protein [Acidimicrobiales bacterium]|nr:LCP family protein [Acidimicrobiales bacterium]
MGASSQRGPPCRRRDHGGAVAERARILVVVQRIGGVVAAALVLAGCSGERAKPSVVVGSTTSTQATALPTSTIALPPPPEPATSLGAGKAETGSRPGLKPADGHPYGPAIAFRTSVAVPSGLAFVLVLGSDARPGQDIRRTNADSIHIVAVDPRTQQGTIVGIPRDAWVDIPGRGNGKINSALAHGGPSLAVETVRRLTGLPIQYYVLTGFGGLMAMVDELGGVEVPVDRRMDDSASGARFERGLHHFNGGQALAFSRNRKDVPNGDFSRSENQGTLMLAALAKMRAEVGDDGGLRRWTGVLLRHGALDVAPDRLLGLAALGRGLDPGRLRNAVTPGRIGTAGRQSVVYLTQDASRLFFDLRDDAVISGAAPPPAGSPAGAPAPGPSPSPTPAPAPPPGTTPPTTTAPAPLIPPLLR